jgi:hypothetical protein
MPNRRSTLLAAGLILPVTAATCAGATSSETGPGLHVEVMVSSAISAEPIDGRLLLLVSNDPSAEPRFQINENAGTQLAFGIDVEGLEPGEVAVVDDSADAYPVARLSDIPAGDYWVQGLLNRYETFHRADGFTLKLPPDQGEGQQWNRKPGNLYSEPLKVRLDPTASEPLRVVLDQEIPPIEKPTDTTFIRHVTITSKLLSDFWGRPVELGAVLLLPAGFDEHPDAHYPLAIMHGHFPATFDGFRESPPDPDLAEPDWPWLLEHCPNGHHPDCDAHGYEAVRQQAAWDLYRAWTSADFPRVIVMQIQHANPYYDDSYAVNSASLGPYGDAITHELIPYVEREFRGLGPWARALYGGSTGGWEALAVQVFSPDEYNGSYASCPDPVDFRAYGVVDIYADGNAYFNEGPWARVPRPATRDDHGHIQATLEAANRFEAVLGSHGRSGQQWDIWQAVFGPTGADGYPLPIWDKSTGVIDPEVAAYWRDHADLRAIMARDWATLGPKLRGKLHVYCGDMDNFYLDGAVHHLETFLATADPPADAEVRYGDGDGHCWSGDADNPNILSRLTYHQRFIPQMAEHWLRTAPQGADTTSWRY